MANKVLLILNSILYVQLAPIVVNPRIDDFGLEKLRTWGYLSEDEHLGSLKSKQLVVSAIKHFQRYAYLNETGIFDDETRNKMKAPRCGMADTFTPEVQSNRKKRFSPQGSKWLNRNPVTERLVVTWQLENSNNDGITDLQVRQFMYRSLDKWSKAADIDFLETPNAAIGSSQIRVRFAEGTHSDQFPFDGPSGTLAHAFFPLNNQGLSGDIHFDDAENYSILDLPRSSGTIKLLWVAVHELGHSIGLSHSDLRGAVMYPWYLHFPGLDFNLTTDDVLGIQAVYGTRPPTTVKPTTTTMTTPTTTRAQPGVTTKSTTTTSTTTTKPTTTTTTTTPESELCPQEVKAVFLGWDNKTYIFNGDNLYISELEIDGIERVTKVSVFEGLQFADTVHKKIGVNNVAFLHGDTFSVYENTKRISSGRKISDGYQGLPDGFRDVDASFLWPVNNKLYLFKGVNYWRFTQLRNMDYTLDRNYPKTIRNNWVDVPDNIDAVFTWKNGETYFFKGENYYRFDKHTLEVRSGYPQRNTRSFLRCSSKAENVAGNLSVKSSASISFANIIVILFMMALVCFQNGTYKL